MSKQFYDEDDFFSGYQPSASEDQEISSFKVESIESPQKTVQGEWNENEIFSGRPMDEDEDDSREIFSSSEKEESVRSGRPMYHTPGGDAVLSGKPQKKKTKRSRETLKRVIMSCILIGIITCCLIVGIFSIYVFGFVDSTLEYDLNNLRLQYTSVVFAPNESGDGYYELAQIHGSQNRIWVDYDDISPYLGDAIVAIEDKRFYDHEGVDWKRTFSAFANMFVDIYGNTQGGSTITQQLVKNLTGDKDRSAARKIQEIMRARYVEGNYPKLTILECYINTVHFGKGCDGVETAARYYFGKSPKDLTLLECAALAATIQTPTSKNPVAGPEKNKERRELVLSEMLSQGLISQAEYDQAMSEELVLATDGVKDAESSSAGANSYYVDTVVEQVISDLMEQKGYTETEAETMLYTGGLQIYSTYNAKVQQALDETFANDSNFLKVGKDTQPQSAVTVMDYEGHIVGIMGGRGEKTGKREYNRATMAKRQPGSTMKPIASYGPALEFNLITYSEQVLDSPVTLADGSKYPKGSGSGAKVYAYKALERSLNSVSARLANELTPQKSFDFVTDRLGISTLVESEKTSEGKIISDINLSAMALGGCTYGVTVTEMCAAYAAFGNLGKYYEPTTYTVIKDTFGTTILTQKNGTPAFSEDTANIMNEMMQNVLSGSQGTGRAGQFGGWDLYGKTGTTNDNKDRWFIGGSPYYVTACWFGFDTPKEMNGLSTNPALKVWTAAMKKMHEGLEKKQFPKSDLVTRRYYCTDTGLLATENCVNKAPGYFKKAYLPSCNHGGSLLGEYTGATSSTTSSGETENQGTTETETAAPADQATDETTAPEAETTAEE